MREDKVNREDPGQGIYEISGTSETSGISETLMSQFSQFSQKPLSGLPQKNDNDTIPTFRRDSTASRRLR